MVEIGVCCTPQGTAAAVSEALGWPVEANAIPRDYWLELDSWPDGDKAENWTEMLDGFNTGQIDFGRVVVVSTGFRGDHPLSFSAGYTCDGHA